MNRIACSSLVRGAVAATLALIAGTAAAQTTITTSTTLNTAVSYGSGLRVGGASPGPTLTIDSGAAVSIGTRFTVGLQTNPYATVVQNAGSVSVSGPLYLGENITNGNTVYTGSASYTLNGGTITLNTTNAGFLQIGRSSSSTFTQNGGLITASRNGTALAIGASDNGTYTITSGTFNASGTSTSATVPGLALAGIGASGTLTVNGASATVAVRPYTTSLTANGGSATVELLAGTLALNGNITRGQQSSGNTPGTVSFTLGGGTLRPYGGESIGLAVGPTPTNTLPFDVTLAPSTTSTITGVDWLNGTARTVTMHSALVGSGNIEIAGGLVEFRSGSSSYSGTTTVTGGTLALSATGSFASSPTITVASGGRLDLTSKTSGFAFAAGQTVAGAGTIALPTAGSGVSLAGFLAPGGTAAGTLTFANAGLLDLTPAITSASGRLQFGLGAIGSSDLVTLTTGTLALGTGLLDFSDFAFTALTGISEGTYTLFSAGSITGSLGSGTSGAISGGYTGTLQQSGNQIQLVVVPEPQTLVLAGLGSLGIAWALRRRWR